MTGNKGDGPDTDERRNPGGTDPNPAGTSSEAPAEGADDAPPPGPGSPEE
jgi:hypothetical protein